MEVDLPTGEVQLWLASLAVSEDELSRLQGLLAPFELQRAERFRVAAASRRFVAARAALRLVLANATGVAPADLKFRFGEHGKPRLADGGPHFNASDSGDVVVIALTSVEVGVDIELPRSLARSERLARRICTERELEALRQAPEGAHDNLLLRMWTCKEAALKAIGIGLSGGVRNVEVEIPANGTPRLTRIPGRDRDWSLLFADVDHDALCTVVARGFGWRTALSSPNARPSQNIWTTRRDSPS